MWEGNNMYLVILVVAIAGASGEGATPADFTAKASDPKALLELADAYEKAGELGWAEQCCRQARKVAQGALRAEATFRWALVEQKLGRFESAFQKLRELRDRDGHAGARDVLAKAESEATRKQQALLADAEKSLKAGDADKARKLFTEAHDLAPEKVSTAAFVPRAQILPRIAACVDQLDDEYYKKKIQPVERKVTECTKCSKDGGFLRCTPCGGAGVIKYTVRIGRVQSTKEKTCNSCGGVGWGFCPQCWGIQYIVASDLLGRKEQEAVIGLISKVRALPVLKKPLGMALADVEGLLLRLEESAALNFFCALKPKYSLSNDIRSALARVPPEKTDIDAARPSWEKPANGIRGRANLLIGYACEYAQHLRHYDMLRKSPRLDTTRLADARGGEKPPIARPVAPEVLSAFPDDGTAGRVHVKATFRSYGEEAVDDSKGILALEGASPHNVKFFVWRPEAQKHLALLEKGPWGQRMSGLSKAYPYKLREKCLALRAGRGVTVSGRFLRDRLGYPRNWFEVWEVKLGLTPEQEGLRRLLVEPIDVVFPSISLQALASFLKDWYGLAVTFEGISSDAPLACKTQVCPLALFLEEVAKALSCDWQAQGTEVVFTKAPKKGLAANAKAVVAQLSASASSELKVMVAQASSRSGPAAGDTGDLAKRTARGKKTRTPAELQAELKASLRAMQYDVAADCVKALPEAEPKKDDAARGDRLWNRCQLFHELTGPLPVSALAGAKDLIRLDFRTSAGEERSQTVRLLERGKGFLVVQPSYGGKVQIKNDRISVETPLSADDWRAAREKEMSERVRELEEASPRGKPQKLFLLAVAAKTNGFPERGTAWLDKAVNEKEFAWVIETFFPARSARMLDLWRKATSQGTPEVAAKPEKPDEPSKGAQDGSAKLPPIAAGPSTTEPWPREPQKLFARAQEHTKYGRTLLARALPGMDEATAHRKQARQQFEAAREALDRFLALVPEDREAERLKRDVTAFIQTCVKDLGFFD
jgi:tetratricopeptide (TPR) repeat protein